MESHWSAKWQSLLAVRSLSRGCVWGDLLTDKSTFNVISNQADSVATRKTVWWTPIELLFDHSDRPTKSFGRINHHHHHQWQHDHAELFVRLLLFPPLFPLVWSERKSRWRTRRGRAWSWKSFAVFNVGSFIRTPLDANLASLRVVCALCAHYVGCGYGRVLVLVVIDINRKKKIVNL